MARPRIGIPTRFLYDGSTASQVHPYLQSILEAGGLPVMIPLFAPLAAALEYLDRLDGLLLPGSPHDIDPARFGESPHPRLGKMFAEREILDFALLEHSERSGLPVFGICFGAQSLNVFRGGTLIQDIPALLPESFPHDDNGNPQKPAQHSVRLIEGSLLGPLAGGTTVEVNSFHHQSVGKLGTNLQVVATAPDGVVEAIQDTGGRFVLGVQWHPEREGPAKSFSRAIFRAFIEEAGKSHS